MTEVEIKEQKESLHRRQNFGLILASTTYAMLRIGWLSHPALMAPGLIMNGIATWRLEKMRGTGEKWGSKIRNMIPIFRARDHHGDHGGTHSGHHSGGHDSHSGGHAPGGAHGHGGH